MVKTNLYGEDITKVRRQQFEVSMSWKTRETCRLRKSDQYQLKGLRPLFLGSIPDSTTCALVVFDMYLTMIPAIFAISVVWIILFSLSHRTTATSRK